MARTKKIVSDGYALVLKHGDDVHESVVPTLEPALAHLPNLKSGAKLSITKDGKHTEVLLYPRQAKKLAVNRIFREIFVKRIHTILK